MTRYSGTEQSKLIEDAGAAIKDALVLVLVDDVYGAESLKGLK